MDRKVMKPFEFVNEYVDTSEYSGKPFLPILISESVSDYYYRKHPRKTKEIIKGSKLSGVKNESITQYLGNVYQKVNPYDNFIYLFDKNFVSPLSNFGDIYYDYQIVDTLWIDKHFCFEIIFEPKLRQELLFRGSMWIHDTTFAVKKIRMRIIEGTNLNFVSDIYVDIDYSLMENRYWMVNRDYIMVDFNPLEESEKTAGLFLHRTSLYRNFALNEPKDDQFYSEPTEVVVLNNARERNDAYWENARPEKLTRRERDIYYMVDTIKNVPAFRTYLDIGYALFSGYYRTKYVEIGPYFKSLSFNSIEGTRIRLGGRTTMDFSERIRLDGYAAYGFKDERFKFGGDVTYFLSKAPRRSISFGFKDDLEQLGQSSSAFSEDNFFAALFRRAPANKLTFVREYNATYEHEWFPGLMNKVRFLHRDMFGLGDTEFIINEGDTQYEEESLISSEIQFYTRFAFRERYLDGKFNRTTIPSKYPAVELLYGYGIPGLLGGEYEYHRLQFRVTHWFNVFSIGWSKYIVESGKIWGTLPYPMLVLHPGNETFLFYENAFNLMYYYEFISDRYLSLYYTHHFDGLIWNRVPLVRKLKWRTVIHGRAVVGDMTTANLNYSEFPEISGTLEKPYYEAGVGIENIFKFFRVDAVWRLSQLNSPETKTFGVFVSFQLIF
jgi:hypothetical protein